LKAHQKKIKTDTFNLLFVLSELEDNSIRVQVRLRELAGTLFKMTATQFHGMSQGLKDKTAGSLVGRVGEATLLKQVSGPFKTFVWLNFEEEKK
jgi:hypothetical protein